MKIIFSDNTLWGLLNFRIDVIYSVLDMGHEVVLVAPRDAMCNLQLIPNSVKYIPVSLSRTAKNPLSDIRYYRELKKIYRAENPDYIFHYTIKPNIYGTLAARSLKIPSTAMIAGLGHVYIEGGIRNAIARLMYKYAMRFPENVMVLNKTNYNTLIEKNVVVKSKLLLLESGEGVNLVKFQSLAAPYNKEPVFLMIGRVLYDKGYTEYVETARKLKDRAKFQLMGSIDSNPTAVNRETLEIDVADETIEYIEFTPDVVQHIAKADAIVLPSYHEGLSRVLMEALALAKPIITTDIPGCRETVDHNINGYLVEPKNTESLIRACEKFISLSNLEKQNMSLQSRVKAEKQFDVQTVVEIYNQILTKYADKESTV